MAPASFLRLLSIFSLALLNISLGTLPANALAVERGHMARGINHAHAGFAKKRGDSSSQCKPRPSAPSSSSIKANLATPSPVSQPSPNTIATSSSKSSEPSSAPSATSSSSGSSGSGKITLMWSNEEESSFCNFITSQTKYYGNWQSQKSSYLGNCQGIDELIFAATIHDPSQIDQVATVVKDGYKFIKFFNEPNIGSQANVDPTYAASLWQQHMQPLWGQGIKCISPSVTTDDTGFNWLQTFTKACSGCSYYAHDLHHYSLHAQDLITAANKFHDTFNLNFWVSEIGCTDYSSARATCTTDLFNTFFAEVQSFCESTSWIETYAFFSMFRADELPNGVSPANSMITCPNGPGSSCHPNANGYKYLNP